MDVQHGVVVLVKTDDMGERGHDRFQFGESLSVRAGDSQSRGSGSSDLKWRVGQKQLIVPPVHICVVAKGSIRQRLSAGRARYIGHGVLLDTKRMCPQIGPNTIVARFSGGEAEEILAGRGHRLRMFMVIVGQAAIDYQQVNLLRMSFDKVGGEDRIAIGFLQREM